MSTPLAPRRSLHPGMHLILDKLHRKAGVSDDELQLLQRQIAELESHAPHASEVAAPLAAPSGDMLPGHATATACEQHAARFGRDCVDFYRPAQDLLLSSIGIGTYRGAMDDATDAIYIVAIHAALRSGVNLVDTSLNYRHQRAERCVATALRRFIDQDGGTREGVVICSKGGFLVPGAVDTTQLVQADVAGGVHCMKPVFLADQIARSRRNLGLETIDIYYLHNPEVQCESIGRALFMERLRHAFEQFERAVSDGHLRYYGIATWNGFRDGVLSLPELARLAHEVGGARHHFRFVQLPFNLGMREARQNRILEEAMALGMHAVASAALLQARLVRDLPANFRRAMPACDSDAQCAIQFARSTPGIATALVGMRTQGHVAQNLQVARIAPLSPAQYRALEAMLA